VPPTLVLFQEEAAAMQPEAFDLTKLALYDPIAAYGILLGIPRVPIIMNSSVSFTTFTTEQIPIEAALDTTLAYRTWIDTVTYSVNPQGQFQGNVFQTTYAGYLRFATGISVRAEVLAGPKYIISQQFTPLENYCFQFAARYPAGWPLFKQQQINHEFMLTAVPGGSTTNLTSYDVTLTYAGWQFLDPSLDEMDASEARECLRNSGINVPEPCKNVRANLG
jgi:hypothetical protein